MGILVFRYSNIDAIFCNMWINFEINVFTVDITSFPVLLYPSCAEGVHAKTISWYQTGGKLELPPKGDRQIRDWTGGNTIEYT